MTMHQLWSNCIRTTMIRSISNSSWIQLLRMTTPQRLYSSSGPNIAGAAIVPCEAVGTSTEKEAEDEAPGTPTTEHTRLGPLRRKALVAEAMSLKSTDSDTTESGSQDASKKLDMSKVASKNILRQQNLAGELDVVAGVVKDDEAARMVPSLSLEQKIRVLSKLTTKRRRSVPLLRALATSITAHSEPLGLKMAADVLFATSTLNFPDGPLLERAATDAVSALAAGEGNVEGRLAVVRSVAVSLGLLRYRDIELLEQLSMWLLSKLSTCRPQDLTAVLLTLAAVNYVPSTADDLFQALTPRLKERDFPTASAWLDTVWALAVLDRLLPEHAASVLRPEFLSRLARTSGNAGSENSIAVGSKLKLLNVNAVAENLIPTYKGPLLQPTSELLSAPLGRTKEKQATVKSVVDALTNLLPSSTYLRSDVNTGMGFLLDAECMVDSKCNPLPLVDSKPSSSRVPNRKPIRVALCVWGYTEVCRGRGSPPPVCGLAALAERLLEARGYRVLRVNHEEFGDAGSSLVRRVQFLEKRLKQLAAAPVAKG